MSTWGGTFLTSVHLPNLGRAGSIIEAIEIPKTAEFQEIPACLQHEPVLIPEQIPLPDVVDAIIDSTDFSNFKIDGLNLFEENFKKPDSIGLLHDAYWYMITQIFKSEEAKKDLVETQQALFGRMSENFVKMFYRIPISYKDSYFDNYPNILAQTLFQSMYLAFPGSQSQFNDELKVKMLTMVSEWVDGQPGKPKFNDWLPAWRVELLVKKDDVSIHSISRIAATVENEESSLSKVHEFIPNAYVDQLRHHLGDAPNEAEQILAQKEVVSNTISRSQNDGIVPTGVIRKLTTLSHSSFISHYLHSHDAHSRSCKLTLKIPLSGTKATSHARRTDRKLMSLYRENDIKHQENSRLKNKLTELRENSKSDRDPVLKHALDSMSLETSHDPMSHINDYRENKTSVNKTRSLQVAKASAVPTAKWNWRLEKKNS